MTGSGTFVEVQGTAEGAGAAFDRDVLNALLDLAAGACAGLTAKQTEALGESPRERVR
jgi:ribonuclease PH